jgi:hypothetical protein
MATFYGRGVETKSWHIETDLCCRPVAVVKSAVEGLETENKKNAVG